MSPILLLLQLKSQRWDLFLHVVILTFQVLDNLFLIYSKNSMIVLPISKETLWKVHFLRAIDFPSRTYCGLLWVTNVFELSGFPRVSQKYIGVTLTKLQLVWFPIHNYELIKVLHWTNDVSSIEGTILEYWNVDLPSSMNFLCLRGPPLRRPYLSV
jgi:hypothetical protein